MLNKQQNNLQDIFLNGARKSKMLVSIYLTNGFLLKGLVKGFDNFTVILDSEGKQMMVYKHALQFLQTSLFYLQRVMNMVKKMKVNLSSFFI